MNNLLPILIFCGVVILAVYLIAYLLRERRKHVFQSLAKRHGLYFVETELGPKVTGVVKSRQVVVTTTEAGSDDEAGVVVVRVSVELKHVPPTMFAESEEALIGQLNTLGEERVLTKSDDFNNHVVLKGDSESVLNYWTTPRQSEFLSIIQAATCDQIRIENQTLSGYFRSAISDLDRTNSLLQQLLNSAQAMDAAQP